MKQNVKFYLNPKNFFTIAAAVCMILAAACRCIGIIPQIQVLSKNEMVELLALPMAACLLYAASIAFCGEKNVWLSIIPVIFGVMFFILRLFTNENISGQPLGRMSILLKLLLYVTVTVIYTATVTGSLRTKYIQTAVIFLLFACHAGMEVYPAVKLLGQSLTWSSVLLEAGILFIMLGLLFASLGLKKAVPADPDAGRKIAPPIPGGGMKVSDPEHPSYLLIANDPEMESIIGALNALILNRLVTRVNTGQGKNVPVSIIVDELPTLYFHKIDRLIGTARSNKVSVTLGFQELPQLESDYGKVGMQKVITTVGNVVSGSARAKETLEWLSNDIFGKVVQLKKGVTIDRDRTSINLNENMDNLVPASKISDMPTGWICGQTARDFVKTKTGHKDSMNIQESAEFQTSKFYCKTDFNMKEIADEEKQYMPLPKFYTFSSREAREHILYENFVNVNREVEEMCRTITQFAKK